ncbi:MAG: hypothetical protein P8X80_13080, partial [Desulfobacterales bacterium]
MSGRDQNLSKPLDSLFKERGYRGKVVSIEHIAELETEIMTRYRKGLLNSDLYDAYLASFDFACHQKFKNARSLIIVTVPQPQIQLTFFREDKPYPVVIPPTYYSAIDNDVADFLKTVLKPRGY